jgi:hypothetical protein
MAKQPNNRRPSKVRPVPIATMRVPPALYTQRPFRKAHGDHLAAELDLNKLGYPIINHRDGINWVCDGQHRVYALKANGFECDNLDCEVYENLSDAEMAEIFLGRDDRRAINPFDKFHVACTAGRTRETDIRRTVEAQGLKISRAQDEDCIAAISALGKVYDRAGAVVLGQTLRTIKQAYGGDTNSFDAQVIEGIGLVFNRYNGLTNEKDLAARLSTTQYGVRGLLRRAEAQRMKTGNQKSQCVAAVVVEVYNKGTGPRAAKRLANWWKQAPDETATE